MRWDEMGEDGRMGGWEETRGDERRREETRRDETRGDETRRDETRGEERRGEERRGEESRAEESRAEERRGEEGSWDGRLRHGWLTLRPEHVVKEPSMPFRLPYGAS
jgi:hypothetical protein